MQASHGRYPYSPITRRPDFSWPNRTRLAVYFALGIEHYAFGEGMTEDLVAGMSQPDVLNASWRDYGNRVGAWRVLDAFSEWKLPLSILLNAAVCDHAPDLVSACTAAGHEIIAHGESNSHTLATMDERQEAIYLREVSAKIADRTGIRPQGWASPWIAETPRTPDLLNEAGYGYLLDWCMDDQPVWMTTRAGPLLSVPYSQELNDSSAIIGRQVGATEFAEMIVDQFDEMRRASAGQPLVMSVILHAFIIGQPFRLRALRRAVEHILGFADEVWLTRPGEIATQYRALGLDRQPSGDGR